MILSAASAVSYVFEVYSFRYVCSSENIAKVNIVNFTAYSFRHYLVDTILYFIRYIREKD